MHRRKKWQYNQIWIEFLACSDRLIRLYSPYVAYRLSAFTARFRVLSGQKWSNLFFKVMNLNSLCLLTVTVTGGKDIVTPATYLDRLPWDVISVCSLVEFFQNCLLHCQYGLNNFLKRDGQYVTAFVCWKALRSIGSMVLCRAVNSPNITCHVCVHTPERACCTNQSSLRNCLRW